MAWPAWANAAMSGGSGLLGPIFSGLFNKAENKKSRDYNTQMLHEQNTRDDINWQRDTEYSEKVWNMQNQYNERMWHMMNDYNSPASQMARYKEANLNPHLIYGQSNTASPVMTASFGGTPKSSSNSAQASPTSKWDFGDFGGQSFVNSMLATQDSAARTNNLAAQTKVLEQEKELKAAQATGQAIANIGKGYTNESDRIQMENLKKYSGQYAELKLQQDMTDLYNSQQRMQLDMNKDERERLHNAATLSQLAASTALAEGQKLSNEVEYMIKMEQLRLYQMGSTPHDGIWNRKAMEIIQWIKDGMKNPAAWYGTQK